MNAKDLVKNRLNVPLSDSVTNLKANLFNEFVLSMAKDVHASNAGPPE